MKKKFMPAAVLCLCICLTGCGRNEVYSGEGYEFGYDPGEWELNFVTEDGLADFKRKGFDEVSFGVLQYDVGENVTLEERLEASKEEWEKDGCIYSSEILYIDGREWGREKIQQEIGEDKFVYVTLFTADGTDGYSVTFTFDIDSFDKCMKEFEEIFDGFKITE